MTKMTPELASPFLNILTPPMGGRLCLDMFNAHRPPLTYYGESSFYKGASDLPRTPEKPKVSTSYHETCPVECNFQQADDHLQVPAV
ncbi:hypothetical protein TNCV_2014181 [Trichonephila clavipes]|nr:hypothetical protein TNCV_2014181 [Trichonephila clavipes]